MEDKTKIWKTMDELITSGKISVAEKELFTTARQQLDDGKDDEGVAAKLKGKLAFMSLKKQLSPAVVPFFSELSRLYLGYGRRDNITIIN